MRPTRGRDVDSSHNLQLSQIASTFPAPRKGSPPDSIFWVGQPHASPVWLAGLRLALSGDIETNPGPFFCRSCHIALFHFCCFENHFCKPPKFPKSCRLCHLPFCNFCCYLKHFCLLIPITNKQSHQQNFSHSTSQNSNNISQTKNKRNQSTLSPVTPPSTHLKPSLHNQCHPPTLNPPPIPPTPTPAAPLLTPLRPIILNQTHHQKSPQNSPPTLSPATPLLTPLKPIAHNKTHHQNLTHNRPSLSPITPILTLTRPHTHNQTCRHNTPHNTPHNSSTLSPPSLSPVAPLLSSLSLSIHNLTHEDSPPHTPSHSSASSLHPPPLTPASPQLTPLNSQIHNQTLSNSPPTLTPHILKQPNIHTNPTMTPNSPSETNLIIIQININGIRNKIQELQQLINETKADIITIQETKLNSSSKSPNIPGFTEIRKDRTHNKGGGLITYVKNNITFTNNDIPPIINPKITELQIISIHLSQTKMIKIANLYIPPKNSTINTQNSEDDEISNCLKFITAQPSIILTGDINAHSYSWFSHIKDHRGTIIEDILQNSNQIILNTNTPTRMPIAKNQQPSSPDITTISSNLYHQTNWKTTFALSSDHLPIIITVNTKSKYKLQQNRKFYTNYNKADWNKFAAEIDEILVKTNQVENVHVANKILTNAILSADKHHIPKGKIKNNNLLLPESIRTMITERDSIRQANPKDTRLKNLNDEIDKSIQAHKSSIWKEKMDQNWDHKQNSKILWGTIHNLSNKKPKQETNRTITFNNKTHITSKQIATAFNKQFINSTKHATNKNNRIIDKNTHNLQSTYIEITTAQVVQAIRSAKNNNSTGPDNINIKHLKHLGPTAIEYLRLLLNKSLNENTIPHIWKLAKIVPIPKANKDSGLGSSYRPISLLSPIAKTLEKIVLPHITQNIPNIPTQHGFKSKHSTNTALHNINETIADGFNTKKPHSRTIMVALDMSKAFDTVNIHTLIRKIQNTNTPPTIIKFTANYLKGRKAYTTFQNSTSKQSQFKSGVPQGGVLSPVLFNIYMSDLPTPPDGVKLYSYADDITTLSLHHDIEIAQTNLEPYLSQLHNWTIENNLKLNADKSTATLFTLDPSEYDKQLTLHINQTLIPTIKHPKILGLTFDPKLNYNEHIEKTKSKAGKTINLLKALTSTSWGKQKETIATTYKAITRPTLEYANTIWSPIVSKTNINKLQTIQNTALRVATGCTKDTNLQHLHEETSILPLKNHLQLHASQIRQKAEHPSHPLHSLIPQNHQPRFIRQTIFHNRDNYTLEIKTDPNTVTDEDINTNMKTIHTALVQKHLDNRQPNKIINRIAPKISTNEKSLPRKTRRTLAQLRDNKSPILLSYLNKIDPFTYPSPLCPLCKKQNHDTTHLFNCPLLPTNLVPMDLWLAPERVAALLAAWERVLSDS